MGLPAFWLKMFSIPSTKNLLLLFLITLLLAGIVFGIYSSRGKMSPHTTKSNKVINISPSPKIIYAKPTKTKSILPSPPTEKIASKVDEDSRISLLVEEASLPLDEIKANRLLSGREIPVLLAISINPAAGEEFYGDVFFIMQGLRKTKAITDNQWNEVVANLLDNPSSPQWVIDEIKSLDEAPSVVYPMEEL